MEDTPKIQQDVIETDADSADFGKINNPLIAAQTGEAHMQRAQSYAKSHPSTYISSSGETKTANFYEQTDNSYNDEPIVNTEIDKQVGIEGASELVLSLVQEIKSANTFIEQYQAKTERARAELASYEERLAYHKQNLARLKGIKESYEI